MSRRSTAALAQTRMRFLPPPRETLVVKSILQALAFSRCLVWRSNTGGMHLPEGQKEGAGPAAGPATSEESGGSKRKKRKKRKGRYVAFGLGTGSADIVGMTSKGRFFALEAKSETGRLTPDQRQWHADVTAKGGYVATVRSAEAALRALAQAEAGLPSPPIGEEP